MAELNTEEKLAHESAILNSDVKSWWVLKVLNPLESIIRTCGLQADAVSYAAMVLTFPCIFLLAKGYFLTAGWLTLLIGSLDVLDGKIARSMGTDGPRGELLDSVLDRLQDFLLLVGLTYYFMDHWVLWFIFVIMGASGWVSYIKAKAEILGANLKKVGLMQRPERFFLLSIGLLFDGALEVSIGALGYHGVYASHGLLIGILVLIAVLTLWTAWQRFNHAQQQLFVKGSTK